MEIAFALTIIASIISIIFLISFIDNLKNFINNHVFLKSDYYENLLSRTKDYEEQEIKSREELQKIIKLNEHYSNKYQDFTRKQEEIVKQAIINNNLIFNNLKDQICFLQQEVNRLKLLTDNTLLD